MLLLAMAARSGKQEILELILDIVISLVPSSSTKDAGQVLSDAVAFGKPDMLRLLLNRGVMVKANSKEAEDLLFAAVRYRDQNNMYQASPEMLVALLEKGVTVQPNTEAANRLLLAAARLESSSMLETLLENGVMDQANTARVKALLLAVLAKATESKQLIDSNSSPVRKLNALLKKNGTVQANTEAAKELLLAAVNTGTPEMFYVLLDNDVRVDANTSNAFELLSSAVRSREPKMLELLFANGVTVGANTPEAFELLSSAIRSREPKMLKLLLKHGVTVAADTPEARELLLLAARSGNPRMLELLLDRVNNNVSVEHLFAALNETQNEMIIRWILEKGVNISTPIDMGNGVHQTVYSWCLENKKYGYYKMLHARHPDIIGLRDNNGNTPLHNAVIKGDHDQAELLVSLGADTLTQNKQKKTPLSLATANENPKMLQLLLGKQPSARNLPLEMTLGYSAFGWLATRLLRWMSGGQEKTVADMRTTHPLFVPSVSEVRTVSLAQKPNPPEDLNRPDADTLRLNR